MRKANYSDGFLLCFFLNLLLNYWIGLVALALWALHLWLGIPLFISLIALGAWVGFALFATILLSIAANGGSAPKQHEQRNVNPYSAKTSDFLPPRRDANEQIKSDQIEAERNVHAPSNGQAAKTYYPAYIPAGSTKWAEISHCLFDAAALIHMSESEFDVLEEQVLSGARDPGNKGSQQSDSDRLYWFLDGMDELGYIAYQNRNAEYTLVADSLSLSAENQGLSSWRVFLINDGTDGCYLGVVSNENAADYVSLMRGCFSLVEHEYRIELLSAMPSAVDQTPINAGLV